MKYVNHYNTVEFYVGEVTEPQTVKIYTDSNTYVDIEVREGNKWYTYLLPKDKGLCMIEGDSVKKVVVKANISDAEELTRDLMALLAIFRGKYYRRRSLKIRNNKLDDF